MLYLGHIQPTKAQQEECKYFCTITLPKCHYTKGALKQYEAMNRHILRIGNNYFEKAYGSYEFTQKGNIHCHLIVKLRPHLELQNNMASAKMMSSFLKSYSNCDFQAIKHLENIIDYLYKDLTTSTAILQVKSPIISLEPKPSEIRQLSCEHGICVNEQCSACNEKHERQNTLKYEDELYKECKHGQFIETKCVACAKQLKLYLDMNTDYGIYNEEIYN